MEQPSLQKHRPSFQAASLRVVAMQQALEAGKPTLEVQKEQTTGVIQTQVVITHRAHTIVSFTCSSLQVVNVEHRGNSTQV